MNENLSETPGIDRRQLLKIGAWATPVIVVAGVAPAASASPVVLTDDALQLTSGSIYSYGGKIGVGVQLFYQPSAWGDVSPATPPATLTSTWAVEAIDVNGVSTQISNPTQVFAQFQSVSDYREGEGFVVGATYTVRFSTSIIQPTPETSGDVTFQVTPLFVEREITVSQVFLELPIADHIPRYAGPGGPTP